MLKKEKSSRTRESQTYYTYETKCGNITIISDGNAVVAVRFGDAGIPGGKQEASALSDLAAKQLEEYFSGKRKQFDIPIRLDGTVFQVAVRKELAAIPYGETRSYKQIAENIGNPKAFRAVGLANNRNPIVIIIPCHRVIGSSGELVGFGGGLELKQRLLDIEKSSD